MNGGKKQFRGLETALVENCLAERRRCLVVKAKVLDCHQDEVFPALLESDGPGRQRIMDSLRQFLPALVAGERHGGGWSDVDAGGPCAQRAIRGGGKAHGQGEEDGREQGRDARGRAHGHWFYEAFHDRAKMAERGEKLRGRWCRGR